MQDDDAAEQAYVARMREHAKRELRARMRAVRALLPEASRAERSRAATAQVLALPEYERAHTIIGFCAIHKELDPAGLLAQAHARGKRLGLPRVDGELLRLHQYTPDTPLLTGAFGVSEPDSRAPAIAPEQVDLVLVPALAFDVRGHRIGYGRAFYDRLLPGLTQAFRLGLAYDFQLVAELPNDPHDVPMHCVITDKRCLRM